MRLSTWIVWCLSVLMPMAVMASAPDQQAGEPVTIGHRYKIESKVLQETRSSNAAAIEGVFAIGRASSPSSGLADDPAAAVHL